MPRRDELLTAAREVIQRNGFASATVGEITRTAGASLGLLNYHFASKDDVVAEAFAAVAREELDELAEISRRYGDPAERLAAFLDMSEWSDRESWRLWVDAWGEAVHAEALRETLERFNAGWRAVLAEVLADGARAGCWECEDPDDAASRLVMVVDGIGLHATLLGVPPERASAWARRLAALELGIELPAPPPPVPAPSAPAHEIRIAIRARDLDGDDRVDPAVLVGYLQEGRAAWLAAAGLRASVAQLSVEFLRPLTRADGVAVVRCEPAGAARTRETVAAADGGLVAAASATLEVAQ
ncbi:MAG TPA: TetR family transcriptional regulator C-terminal domain-containing protein [Solirubrobacteraceae bacterium]|jgi:AcrR family transcriptional regulator